MRFNCRNVSPFVKNLSTQRDSPVREVLALPSLPAAMRRFVRVIYSTCAATRPFVGVSTGELLVLDYGIPHDVEAIEESAFLIASWPGGTKEERHAKYLAT